MAGVLQENLHKEACSAHELRERRMRTLHVQFVEKPEMKEQSSPSSGAASPADSERLPARRHVSQLPTDRKSVKATHRISPCVYTMALIACVWAALGWTYNLESLYDGGDAIFAYKADALGRTAWIAWVLVLVLSSYVFIYQMCEKCRHAQQIKTMSPFYLALKSEQSDQNHLEYLQQEFSKSQAQLYKRRPCATPTSSIAPTSSHCSKIAVNSRRDRRSKTVSDFVNIQAQVDLHVLVAEHKQEKLNELAKTLHSWNFDIFEVADVTSQPLAFTGFICLEAVSHALPDEFVVDKPKLHSFLSSVESTYRDVPYHNALHGANVAHMVLSFCEGCGLGMKLPEEMQYTLVLAGLVHDIHHPGVNASFLSNASSMWNTPVEAPLEAADMELSIMYNDQSPLEHMHCAVAFKLLRRGENAFLPSATIARIRPTLVRTILGTDMAKHAETMTKLAVLIDNKQNDGQSHIPWWWPSSPPASMDVQKRQVWEHHVEEEFVMELFLHAADVGTPSLPIGQLKRWNSMCQAEFHNQGDLERREFGRLISPPAGFDREASAKAQHIFTKGFMHYVSLPLFQQIDILTKVSGSSFVASGVNISCCMENLDRNLKIWDETVPWDNDT